MNTMEMMNMLNKGINPKDLAMNLLQNQMGNTPIGQNLMMLAKNDKGAERENFARNMFKEQGRDFDSEFNSFKQMLGIK